MPHRYYKNNSKLFPCLKGELPISFETPGVRVWGGATTLRPFDKLRTNGLSEQY